MKQSYQITLDDIQQQEIIKFQPERLAYIDECGCFGFDFSLEGVSEYYILCAVVVEESYQQELRKKITEIKIQNGFSNTEMKSSKIGNEHNRRTRIISQLLPIDFKVILLIADKKEFKKGTPLTEYRKTFIKFLHQRLYNLMYHVYPKLKIVEDETGTTEFQSSFKKYVIERRPEFNLFNDYDFDYCDSKNEILVQLADIVGGSINKYLTDSTAPNYLEMLKGKMLVVEEFPSKKEPYWGTASPEDYQFNKDVYALAIKCANDFIAKNENDDNDEKKVQVAFLKYLLFQVASISPTKYISSAQILSYLREYTHQRITPNYLYRRVIAPLRDDGVIIASCSHGYKIPISVEDVTTYLNSTHTIVSPMLHRMGICRKLIQQQTGNELDILNDPAFLKYKKYFD